MHIISYIWVLNTQLLHVSAQAYDPQGAQCARFKTSCQWQAALYMVPQSVVAKVYLMLLYHETVPRLVLLYICPPISGLFMCLHMLSVNLDDNAAAFTDKSFLPDNGNQVEAKGRGKSCYNTNSLSSLSLVSTDSQHVAHRLQSILGFITAACLCRNRRRNERRLVSQGVFYQLHGKKANTCSFCT
jgi:hypothetical protein